MDRRISTMLTTTLLVSAMFVGVIALSPASVSVGGHSVNLGVVGGARATSIPNATTKSTSYEYVGTAHGIYKLNRNGNVVWNKHTGIAFHSVKLTSNGRLYALDGNGILYGMDTSGKILWRDHTYYPSQSTNQLALTSNGSVYVAAQDRVEKINSQGTVINSDVWTDPYGKGIVSVGYGDGHIYAGNMYGIIYEINPKSGNAVNSDSFNSGDYVNYVKVGPNGYVYSDTGYDQPMKLTPSLHQIGQVPTYGDSVPYDVAFSGGYAYTANFNGHVTKYWINGSNMSVVWDKSKLSGNAQGIATDKFGSIYVSAANSGGIQKFASSGNNEQWNFHPGVNVWGITTTPAQSTAYRINSSGSNVNVTSTNTSVTAANDYNITAHKSISYSNRSIESLSSAYANAYITRYTAVTGNETVKFTNGTGKTQTVYHTRNWIFKTPNVSTVVSTNENITNASGVTFTANIIGSNSAGNSSTLHDTQTVASTLGGTITGVNITSVNLTSAKKFYTISYTNSSTFEETNETYSQVTSRISGSQGIVQYASNNVSYITNANQHVLQSHYIIQSLKVPWRSDSASLVRPGDTGSTNSVYIDGSEVSLSANAVTVHATNGTLYMYPYPSDGITAMMTVDGNSITLHHNRVRFSGEVHLPASGTVRLPGVLGNSTFTRGNAYYVGVPTTVRSMGFIGSYNGTTSGHQLTQYFSVNASNGNASITVDSFKRQSAKTYGDTVAKMTLSKSNDKGSVDVQIGGLQKNRNYEIYRDGKKYNTVQSTGAGLISFSNSKWSTHTFTVITGSITSNTGSSPASGGQSSIGSGEVFPNIWILLGGTVLVIVVITGSAYVLMRSRRESNNTASIDWKN